MNGVHKFSAHVIDYAERLSDVADAAQGKNHRRAGSTTRWLLLPASGAALYALIRSESFSRQAKDAIDDAKTRAAELPEELIGLVRQTTERSSSPNAKHAVSSRDYEEEDRDATAERSSAQAGCRQALAIPWSQAGNNRSTRRKPASIRRHHRQAPPPDKQPISVRMTNGLPALVATGFCAFVVVALVILAVLYIF